MRILAHIHAWNDDDVIDTSLGAVLKQTRPVDEVLLVDNGSVDDTLNRDFPANVTIRRHAKNTGTSGAVVTGFEYALESDFDWIWIFDADSAPEPDALARLLECWEGLEPDIQERTWILASQPIDANSSTKYRGVQFDRRGVRPVEPNGGPSYYEIHGAMWTGCLYRLDHVQTIGLPSRDWVLDWGEYEYGYRGMQNGLKAFMDEASVLHHNIGGEPSLVFNEHHIGPFSFRTFELPAIRCYYVVRNTIYFWLYVYQYRNLRILFPKAVKISLFSLNFMLRPWGRGAQVWACLRGVRDGLLRKLERRY